MERRPLSARMKVVVTLGAVLALGLVAATGLQLYRIIAYRETRRTLQHLADLRRAEPKKWTDQGLHAFDAPHVGGWRSGDLAFVFMASADDARLYLPTEFIAVGQHDWGLEWAIDQWRRPIRYQCPGPVHRSGWDLWSIGPNGIDDQGEGDDLLVGEDVVPVTSR